MGRALIILQSKADRERATKWIAQAPTGTRVEFKASKRTIPQNDRMYAMLSDVARQATHCGRRYTVEDWKCLFMHALGREMAFLPSLDERTFIPIGYHSSDLTKDEMSNLIELIASWGTEHGVVFHEPERAVA